VLKKLGGVINSAEAGCLGTDERAAVRNALTGENAGELIAKALILAEEITDLSCADTDITRRNVGIRTDVLLKLGHEALAEAHNLKIGLALRIKVRAALAAAHGQRGEGVLEGLLEAEELDNALVNGGMEAKTALVRTDRAVELDSEAAVYLNATVIIYPRNAELDDSFGLNDSFKNAKLDVFGMCLDHGLDGLKNLLDSLMEFGLVGVSLLHASHEFVKILILKHGMYLPFSGLPYGRFMKDAIILAHFF
jgi:hypothetical protein